jgi:hypothetical protein
MEACVGCTDDLFRPVAGPCQQGLRACRQRQGGGLGMAGAVFSNGLRAPYIHADSRAREKAFEYPKENTMENSFWARNNIPWILEIRDAFSWCVLPFLGFWIIVLPYCGAPSL